MHRQDVWMMKLLSTWQIPIGMIHHGVFSVVHWKFCHLQGTLKGWSCTEDFVQLLNTVIKGFISMECCEKVLPRLNGLFDIGAARLCACLKLVASKRSGFSKIGSLEVILKYYSLCILDPTNCACAAHILLQNLCPAVFSLLWQNYRESEGNVSRHK